MTTFSIIIPVKPGGAVTALTALRGMDYPPERFEILVSEGTCPSRQRNLAAAQALGELIYFLDDDSRPVPDALRRCGAAFHDQTVAVVGGPSLTPARDCRVQQLFGAALSSLLGAGAMRNRYRATGSLRRTTERELILCNLAFRRDLFLAVGGFDERLYPNEENELLDRLAGLGHTLLHEPAMAVERSQRPTLAAFMRQMFGYGRGRAQQTLLAGPASLLSFAPLLLVCYLLLLPLLPAALLWKLPLAAYALLVAGFSATTALVSRRPVDLLLVVLVPLMHCCNGVGLARGFAGGRPAPRGGECRVNVRHVKEFGQGEW